jgi:phage terminase large subunit GpA-like protein
MSARSCRNWDRMSGLTSRDGVQTGEAFTGDQDLLRVWAEGLQPDADLTVSEWADQYRMLASRASAEPGRYRTKRTPYMREIKDALSPNHTAQRVVFMKAAQVGATEAGNNMIGFVIAHAPGPMLAVQPGTASSINMSPPLSSQSQIK